MAQSLKTQIKTAETTLDAARSHVFQFGSHDMTFAECKFTAPMSVSNLFEAAMDNLTKLQSRAIETGRARRNSVGSVVFYR